MRDAFSAELYDIAASNPNVIVMTGDTGLTVFGRFRTDFPDRFINMGVSEANMIGVAAGLALNGKVPFVYTIVPFLTMRPFEQIRVDICIQNLPVKIVGVGGGLAYGPLGPTHHSIEDVAILRALPNMTVLVPCDPSESKRATRAAFEDPGPVYVRLGKNGEPSLHENEYDFQIGRAVQMRDGNDATVIVTGGVTKYALEASDCCAQVGLGVRVLDMHTNKPIDEDAIIQAARETRAIVTVEEHNVIGGLGSAVAEVLAEAQAGIPFRRLGINDSFCYGVGGQEYHLANHGVTSEHIAKVVCGFLDVANGEAKLSGLTV